MVQAVESQIAEFRHPLFGEIRVVDRSGDPWWIAKDVCESLGIDTSNLAKVLDDDERATCSVYCTGQVRNVVIVSEPGLYSLVLRSRKPDAKAFKRWVTHEVLPQIRKTGSYTKPETFEELSARCLTMAQEKIALLEQQRADDAPKVDFHDRVTGSGTVCQLGVACQVASLPMGRNTLFKTLREQGVLISVGERRNHPRQEYVDRGYFTVVENVFTDDDTGKTFVTFVTHVTQSGIAWLIKRFGSEAVGKVEQ